MTDDVNALLSELRTRQEQLDSDVRRQIAALGDAASASDSAVTAVVDAQGLLDGLSIDPTVRRRISPEDLARGIDHAIRSVQQPASAALRAVGFDATSGPTGIDLAALQLTTDRLGAVLSSFVDETPRPDPHVVAERGVRATASFGVVRSVICDPLWLARSTDQVIAEQVVEVCRRTALASDIDLR